MVRNYIIRILLLPFSLLYGLGVGIRNLLYQNNFLNSIKFGVPVISVGNLTVGGAGKTPHVEYLIRLLDPYINLATLSRGYKRKTKGFLEVQPRHTAHVAGDEPVQFKRKYPQVSVYVDESRVFGIPRIMMQKPETQAIVLDDAFQHLSVKPGLNILLTEFDRPFTQDWLLPSGRLREWRSAYKRADIIVVTKCPLDMTDSDADQLKAEIKPLPHQSLFFSRYDYFDPYDVFDASRKASINDGLNILLVSGIARTDYLLDYLEPKAGLIKTLEFEDHHDYTPLDVGTIERHFKSMPQGTSIVLTTEKDAIRLQSHRQFLAEKNIPVFALPLEVKFYENQSGAFDQRVKDFLLEFES